MPRLFLLLILTASASPLASASSSSVSSPAAPSPSASASVAPSASASSLASASPLASSPAALSLSASASVVPSASASSLASASSSSVSSPAAPSPSASESVAPSASALPDFEAAVCHLTGASSLEELDQSVLETFEALASHPLALNEAPHTKLLASGLLSAYQCASLTDYRDRCGDVLSFEELSRIDGFSAQLAQALRPFVRLDSHAAAGRTSPGGNKFFHCEGALQGGWKWKDVGSLSGKFKCSYGGFQAGIGSQGSSAGWSGELHPFVSYEGRHLLRRAIIGDFHARFSQGLCLWSGFSLSGFSSPTSFVRRPTGVKPYSSWSRSASLRGAAVTMGWGRWELTLLGNIPGVIRTGRWNGGEDFVAASVSYLGRWGTLSLTATSQGPSSGTTSSSVSGPSSGVLQPGGRISLGGHGGWKGVEAYGELCVNVPCAASPANWAAVLGVSGTFGEGWRWNVLGRWYDPDFNADLSGGVRAGSKSANEAGVTSGLHWESGRKWMVDATIDACMHPRSRDRHYAHTGQIKSVLNLSWQPVSAWTVRSRASLRLRNYGEKSKLDWKADAAWASGEFRSSAAFQLCRCTGWGLLGALEQSLHFPWGTIYLEEMLYGAPQWADRLYRYERDAPGSFSVPACYGKGYRIALYFSAQPWRGVKCYALAAWRHFVYKGEQRRLLEFRLQLAFSL